MTRSKVSIIIPSWNASHYLGQCLESALNQKTNISHEVVLVDDGSTDDTQAVLKSIKSPLFRFYLRPHLGQAATKNFAIRKTKGEIVIILDADDYLSADAVGQVSVYFDKNIGVYYAYSEHFGVDINGQIIYKTHKQNYFLKNKNKYPEELILHCCYHGHLMAMRKKIFAKVGYFNESLAVGVDYEWILRFCEKQQPGYISKFLYFYREHGRGINKLINHHPRLIEAMIEEALRRRGLGNKKVRLQGRDKTGYRIYLFN